MKKKCPYCQKVWNSAEEIVNDESVYLSGYQSKLAKIEEGYYIFWHKKVDCGTSFTVPVSEFFHLYEGPHHEEILMGKDECPGHCLEANKIDPCPNPCKYAFIREIMKKFKKAVDY